MTIDLRSDDFSIVRSILNTYVPNCEVWVFGSRTTKVHHRYSDLDLLLRGKTPIPLETLAYLSEAFADSDLPFKVDIVDWNRVSNEFKESVGKHFLRI